MAYIAFDGSKPTWTGAGTQFATDTRNNLAALRDATFFGADAGWTISQSDGTASEPTTVLYSKGTERIRLTLAWGTTGGAKNNITSAAIAYSSNSGGAYDTIETRTPTYDASGNCTGGMPLVLLGTYMGLPGKLQAAVDRITALESTPAAINDASASTSTAYSSTKTDARYLQKTGGTMSGDLVVKTASHALVAATASVNWATGLRQAISVAANTTFTFAAPPGPANVLLKVINTSASPRTMTWPASVKWPTTPAAQAATSTALYMFFYDGTTYWGSFIQGYANV